SRRVMTRCAVTSTTSSRTRETCGRRSSIATSATRAPRSTSRLSTGTDSLNRDSGGVGEPAPPGHTRYGGSVGVIFDNSDLWWEALGNTLLQFFAGGGIALVLGLLVGAMRVAPVPIARGVGTVYVNVVRNTPLTLVFFFFAFGYPQLLPSPGFTVLAIWALGVYTATYVAEVVRAGVNTVPVGQAEAARAL